MRSRLIKYANDPLADLLGDLGGEEDQAPEQDKLPEQGSAQDPKAAEKAEPKKPEELNWKDEFLAIFDEGGYTQKDPKEIDGYKVAFNPDTGKTLVVKDSKKVLVFDPEKSKEVRIADKKLEDLKGFLESRYAKNRRLLK